MSEPDFFVDWITISQRFPELAGNLPLFHDGFFINLDSDGNPIYQVQKSSKIEGSYDSRLMLRCDGETVYLSGNVGAFGRPDNVFGYSLEQVISKCNVLLTSIGLPPFTHSATGEFIDSYSFKTRRNTVKYVYDGARVSRLDLTANYSLGSFDDAISYMAYMSSKKSFRVKQRSYGAGETVQTVSYGTDEHSASKYVVSKLYVKSEEMEVHKKKYLYKNDNKGKQLRLTGKYSDYLHKLVDYVKSNGFVRYEVTFKARFLNESGLNFLGALKKHRLSEIYKSRSSHVFTDFSVSNTVNLPRATLRAFNDWKSGVSLRTLFSKPTFYHHRKLILECGFDISYPYTDSVMDFLTKRKVEIRKAVKPDFYFLPEISNHVPQLSEDFNYG